MEKYFVIKSLKSKGYVVLNEIMKGDKVISYTVSDYHTKKEAQRFPYIDDKQAYMIAKKYVWGKIEIEIVKD